MRVSAVAATLGFAIISNGQTTRYCPSGSGNACYSVNIPEQTAAGGTGDIYFQIQGPSTLQWIALGQGGQMAGANIFIIYADASGNNVTLSPRLGRGNFQPNFDSDRQVSLLDGTGIANGLMTANVRCSNCASWNDGSMDFTSSDSSWIWAIKSGSPVGQSSPSVNLRLHDDFDAFTFDLSRATGGNSVNPFLSSATTSDPSSTATAGGVATSTDPSSSGSSSDFVSDGSSGGISSTFRRLHKATVAHGTIMGLAFVIFFPLGAFVIRLASFRNVVWFHAGIQMFSYTLALVGLGLGVYIAIEPQSKLNNYHTIVGLVVICALVFQPVLGHVHHFVYKRSDRKSIWTHVHVWFGRVVLTLGIINGGLGLRLAGNTRSGEIAYGVIAALVWVSWMAVAAWRDRGQEERMGRGVAGEKEGEGSVEMDSTMLGKE